MGRAPRGGERRGEIKSLVEPGSGRETLAVCRHHCIGLLAVSVLAVSAFAVSAVSHTSTAWSAPAAVGAGDERTISFYQIHTKETLTVTYKRNGQFIPEALEKINWILRDWRKNEATKMDPNTVDIVWEMHRELGSKEPVHIISGYRSRGTNDMLRRTRGGQATQSQHITGKAIDVAFPDVPLRRMRYSAMIRERGGVGYYPTSGIPFVHVDTGRVRHWPRMVRDELALIFPSGRSKHNPADGRPITPEDVARARSRNAGLATEVAQFFAERGRPRRDVQVASVEPVVAAPAPKPVHRLRNTELPVSAARAPDRAPATPAAMGSLEIPTPRLVAAPRPADRPSRFKPTVDNADRLRLDELVKLAEFEVAKEPVTPPIVTASLGPPLPRAKQNALAAEPSRNVPKPESGPVNPLYELGQRTSWITAPDFDEDHPEEMSYRPFPILPLMTDTASIDDPALAHLVHPDADLALELLADEGSVPPMRFGPGFYSASLLWTQGFSGGLASLAEPQAQGGVGQTRLASRSVRTIGR